MALAGISVKPVTLSPVSPRGITSSGEIIDTLKENKSALFSVAGFSGIINLLYLTPAIYMLQIYDRVLNSQSVYTLIALTVLAFGIFIALGLLEYFRSSILAEIGDEIDNSLSSRVFHAAFTRQSKLQESLPGQPLWDLNQLRQFFSGNGLVALMDVPWLPIFMVVIFLLHPYLGWFALLGAIILLVLTALAERMAREPSALAQQLTMAANGMASTQLKNTDVISAMGMLPSLTKRWKALHTSAAAQQMNTFEDVGLISGSTRIARLVLQSGILGLGAYLVIYGELSAGSMIAATILMTRALSPLESLLSHWKSLLKTYESVQRLSALLLEYPERVAGIALPRPVGEVVAENIYVTPPGRTGPVLQGITFTLGPREVVGVIGPSASGKSTLGRAILGIWPTQGGKIRLDGSDIYRWNPSELGHLLGYLPQDIELFSGTIAENICRFGEIDSTKCIEAAKVLGIHEMILRFPEGYETHIGDAGVNLSGGQRQLIGLARAVYGNPVLIVLDEPDSNLDEAGEKALMKAIQSLKEQGSTVMVITHRPKLLSIVDRAMLLQDGKVHHVKLKKKEEPEHGNESNSV